MRTRVGASPCVDEEALAGLGGVGVHDGQAQLERRVEPTRERPRVGGVLVVRRARTIHVANAVLIIGDIRDLDARLGVGQPRGGEAAGVGRQEDRRVRERRQRRRVLDHRREHLPARPGHHHR